jgi:hypothetical protein
MLASCASSSVPSAATVSLSDSETEEVRVAMMAKDFCWKVGFAVAVTEYLMAEGHPRSNVVAIPLFDAMGEDNRQAEAFKDVATITYSGGHWTTSRNAWVQVCNGTTAQRGMVDVGAFNLGGGPVGAAAKRNRNDLIERLPVRLLRAS